MRPNATNAACLAHAEEQDDDRERESIDQEALERARPTAHISDLAKLAWMRRRVFLAECTR